MQQIDDGKYTRIDEMQQWRGDVRCVAHRSMRIGEDTPPPAPSSKKVKFFAMSTPSGENYPEEEGGESVTGVIIALLLLGSLAYLTFKVSWVCSWCNVQGFLNAKLLN